MRRVGLRKLGVVTGLVLLTTTHLQALCWGSLYVASRSTHLSTRCPTPTLSKTWRIDCRDGCGHTTAGWSPSLVGFGECFKGRYCIEGVVCLPLAGSDIYGYNPPSLSSTIVNRGGYYASPPCNNPRCRSLGVSTMTVYCDCDRDFDVVWCAENDPILISLSDGRYQLTDRSGGVEFDLGTSGYLRLVPWPQPESDEAFLVLDRDGSGTIDNGRELFGDATPQHASDEPNGFRALALFDDRLSGGNEDGRISDQDEIFPLLQLWLDSNHNGYSEPEELISLVEAGLSWIGLDFSEAERVDAFGNEFRYLAESGWSDGSRRRVWNVFLLAD